AGDALNDAIVAGDIRLLQTLAEGRVISLEVLPRREQIFDIRTLHTRKLVDTEHALRLQSLRGDRVVDLLPRRVAVDQDHHLQLLAEQREERRDTANPAHGQQPSILRQRRPTLTIEVRRDRGQINEVGDAFDQDVAIADEEVMRDV